jgi:succinoglycan biosynthesis transport protein ExoP
MVSPEMLPIMKDDMPRRGDHIGSVQSAESGEDDSVLSFADIANVLRAHARFIGLCVVIFTVLAVICVHFWPPVYEATATIRIDPFRTSSLGLTDQPAGAASQPSDAIQTEIAILKSDGVAIRSLNNLSDADFHSFAGGSATRSTIPINSVTLSAADERLVSKLESHTVIKQQESTQLLDIKFRDRDPRLAAVIANELVHAYAVADVSSRDESASQLRTWITKQMGRLQVEQDDAQAKLAAFQQSHNIVNTPAAGNTITDRLGLLNIKLTDAQADRIIKEGQLKTAVQTGSDTSALVALFPNTKLQAQQAEEVSLMEQHAQMSAKFGKNYQPLIELQHRIDDLNKQIASSASSVKNQLQQQYDAALSTESLLRNQYNSQIHEAADMNLNQSEYSDLLSKVNSTRDLHSSLQRKLEQADVDTHINSVEPIIVDSARAPVKPIEPQKMLISVSAALLGLFVGLLSAFILEVDSDRMDSASRFRKATGHRPLVAIPMDPTLRRSAATTHEEKSLTLVTLRQPLSASSEGYRVLRTVLLTRESDMKTILFASATPEEGLVGAAANFAVCLANTGKRVLLVDTDLRAPGLSASLGLTDGGGLGDYFANGGYPAPIQPFKDIESLHVIPAGLKPVLPAECLASEKFWQLLAGWRESYDYTILMGAPLLLVSDALPLMSHADKTVLVTRCKVTRITDLAKVETLLSQSNASLAGFVVLDEPFPTNLQAADIAGYYA